MKLASHPKKLIRMTLWTLNLSSWKLFPVETNLSTMTTKVTTIPTPTVRLKFCRPRKKKTSPNLVGKSANSAASATRPEAGSNGRPAFFDQTAAPPASSSAGRESRTRCANSYCPNCSRSSLTPHSVSSSPTTSAMCPALGLR
uniref:(northern house mosquito) hypothetical protein n=1 Tax=Culex pipiens TaxID=7175 RepID=A0A8D8JTP8_CULPI